MTAQELIAKLMELPQNMEVRISGPDSGGYDITWCVNVDAKVITDKYFGGPYVYIDGVDEARQIK